MTSETILSQSELTSLSRCLSKILRHKAHDHHLPLRADGYVPISSLLSLPKLKSMGASIDKIRQVVERDAKKRYTMVLEESEEPDSVGWLIRANQGHSIAVPALAMTRIETQDVGKYPVVLHGTNETAYKSIQIEGIKRMTRNHIHLATGKFGDTNVISGIRKSCTVFIYIDLECCMREGMEFYESENRIVLTTGLDGIIPTRLFSRVEFANQAIAERFKQSVSEPVMAIDRLHLVTPTQKREVVGRVQLPQETELMTTIPLFGGALSTVLPPAFLDASEFRQVPDTQEVFVSPEFQDTSLIVELVESLPEEAERAALEHFKLLAEDNDAGGCDVLACLKVETNVGLGWIVHGSQKVGKFNGQEKQAVFITLGVLRLDSVSTDVLITHNSTMEQELGRRRATRAVEDFSVNDWSLFA